MSPAPNLVHAIVCGNLYDLIKAYARQHGGFAAFAPIDVFLDLKNVFQPDVLFVKDKNSPILTDKGLTGAPDLAVEVLSPSNGFKDRNQKKDLYQKFGVKEYWIIDPGNRTIEIHNFTCKMNPVLHLTDEALVNTALMPGFSFEFRDIFNP